MAVSSLGDAFRVVMKRQRWSGAQLARKIGASQPWVSMVLAGRRDPGVRRSAELLRRAGWELELVPVQEDPVRRREFLAAAASVSFVPASTANPYADPAYVDAIATRLHHNEAQLGGRPLAREASRHVARVAPMIGGGTPNWQAAASRLCRQAALILHDVRRLAQAEDVAALSLRFAQQADNSLGRVRAYDTLSMITAHLPDRRGVEYAKRGLAVSDVPTLDRAVLAARLGRALALGNRNDRAVRHDARTALEQALEIAEGHSPSQMVEIAGNAGIGFSDLRLAAPAQEYLSHAVDLAGTQSPFTQSLYLARQAKAALGDRDVQVLAGLMQKLVGVAPLVDSPRLSIHLRHIVDGTRTWASVPEVRNVREHLVEVSR